MTETHTLVLSADAWAVICGMVQGSEDVETTEIYPQAEGVWEEIRRAFPIDGFTKAVRDGKIEYTPEP